MSASQPLGVEIDASSLARLKRKLSAELFSEVTERLMTDSIHVAEGQIKERTPWATGNLRRSIQSSVENAGRYPDPEAAVDTNAVYAWWIETGEDRRGRKMRTKPGGYRMVRDGSKATEKAIGALVDKAAKEIEAKWGSL